MCPNIFKIETIRHINDNEPLKSNNVLKEISNFNKI